MHEYSRDDDLAPARRPTSPTRATTARTRLNLAAARLFRGRERRNSRVTQSRVNPEEAFVASLSTCHMLTFLAIAARKRFTVDSYVDEAFGVMERNAEGKYWVSRVTLRPKVVFSGARQPSTKEISELHHAAHENCFIANSVKTDVTVDYDEAGNGD